MFPGLMLVTGLMLGLLLLLAGVTVGILLCWRQGRAAPIDVSQRQQLVHMLEQLAHWTSNVSSDVSEYRGIVQDLTDQILEQPEGGAGASLDSATLLAQMLTANRRLQQRLEAAESTLEHQQQELAAYMSEARTDVLTRLSNRRVFDEELASSLVAWRAQGKAVALALLDIDHFKQLNDTHGHLAGDAVLRKLGDVLRDKKPPGSTIARIGGEEFAIVLRQRGLIDACDAAEVVRQAVSQAAFGYDRQTLPVTVSVGVALAVFGEDSTSLIKRCDDALYAAKHGGRDAVYYHDGYRSLLHAAGQGGSRAEREEQLHRDFQEVCRDLRARLRQVAAVPEA